MANDHPLVNQTLAWTSPIGNTGKKEPRKKKLVFHINSKFDSLASEKMKDQNFVLFQLENINLMCKLVDIVVIEIDH